MSAQDALVPPEANAGAMVESRTGDEGNRNHDPLEVAGRTAQLLFMGSIIAILGLSFSFLMVVFRVRCDSKFVLATHFEGMDNNITHRPVLCKSSPAGDHPTPEGQLGQRHLGGRVFVVPWTECTKESDCSAFENGLCSGGQPGDGDNDGYCKENLCQCKAVVWDCGLNQRFYMEIEPRTYVRKCEQNFCNDTVKIIIPKWTMHRSNIIGCESKNPTHIIEAMAIFQQEIELRGIISPLKSSDSKVWDKLKHNLAQTRKVTFQFFWPSTISESVSHAMSPEQTIFVGFMLCAAISLFRSDYTTECRTVDMPHVTVPFMGFEWNTIRAWLPPLGLILLSMVQMVPTSEIFNFPQGLMTCVHLIGAQCCFLVYLLAERAALTNKENLEDLKNTTEKNIRTFLNVFGFFAMALFAVTYSAAALLAGKNLNPYVRPPFSLISDMYIRDSIHVNSYLVRPAGSMFRTLKMTSYFSELFVALSILFSHLVVWYFFHLRLVKQHEKIYPQGKPASQ